MRITIYFRDHLPPHIHATFGEREAQLSIATGEVLNGGLPRPKLRAVERWLDANRAAVAYIWVEARAGRYRGGVIE